MNRGEALEALDSLAPPLAGPSEGVRHGVPEPVLVVDRLSAPPALDAVSFDVLPGETVVVLGPAGAGKTTLVRCLAEPHPGRDARIVWNLPQGQRSIAPAYAVTPGDLARALRVGADPLAPVASAMLPAGAAPSLLLFDDPTQGHDPSLQAALIELVDRAVADGPWAAVITTSDRSVAALLADRVILLEDGRVSAFGLPDLVLAVDRREAS